MNDRLIVDIILWEANLEAKKQYFSKVNPRLIFSTSRSGAERGTVFTHQCQLLMEVITINFTMVDAWIDFHQKLIVQGGELTMHGVLFCRLKNWRLMISLDDF